MSGTVVFIILVIIVMFIAWVGNMIADAFDNSARSRQIERELKNNPPKQESLKDRFK